MGPGSTLVVNVDDPATSRLAPPIKSAKRRKLPAEWRLEDMLAETRAALEAQGVRLVPVSRQVVLDHGAWLDGETLLVHGEAICTRDEIQLRGDHNISNLLTACALAHAVGATTAAMREVAVQFHGVAHRLEVVADLNGVTWVNDSIATSPERAIAGMRSFDPAQQTIILLAGGKDKNLPWDAFASEAISRVNFVIGFGQSGPMIVRHVQERARFVQHKAPNCAVVQRLDEAVELAARVAGPNSIVLLSPGGTSFDAYQDFEERGEHFRQLVRRTIQNKEISEPHPSQTIDQGLGQGIGS
jgi:UDP-N-acetylmuramoylalanine--D-glutamate ligase